MAKDRLAISFHGAAGTVTGSKHLVQFNGTRVLLDAGLFQGLKRLRELNWKKPAFDPKKIDQVLLSHTHLDHVGYLPRLIRDGLKAPVRCTPATRELAELILLDSAKIQEEDARYANRKGFSKHTPARPLYTKADAQRTLKRLEKVPFRRWIPLDTEGRFRARFINAGHILGSAFIEMRAQLEDREVRIVYSGDIGRFKMPLHIDPKPMPECDVLIVESTYGDRNHTKRPVADQIVGPIRKTLARRGTVLIPAFALGRSQQVTWVLRRLMMEGRLPEVPIHIDSPMAIKATGVYSRYLDKRNLDEDVFEDGRLRIFPRQVFLHRSVEESKRLCRMDGPRIIISASGMLTAGRVLHHLKRLAPESKNLVFLAGYQAVGTRSRAMMDGAKTVRVHGQDVPVRCGLLKIDGLSGHADRDELLRWIRSAERLPKVAFLVHGDPDASKAFRKLLDDKLDLRTVLPRLGSRHEILPMLS